MRQDSSTARVGLIVTLEYRGRTIGRFGIPHRVLQHVLLAFVLAGSEAIDVLPRCLARYKRHLVGRDPYDVPVFVVQLSDVRLGGATKHVMDVRQSRDGIDSGTGNVAEWIKVKRIDDQACDVYCDLLYVR